MKKIILLIVVVLTTNTFANFVVNKNSEYKDVSFYGKKKLNLEFLNLMQIYILMENL